MAACSVWKEITKYICIQCSIFICNRFSVAEIDEETKGCIAGSSVGYCFDCSILIGEKGNRTSSAEIISNKIVPPIDRFV